MDHHPRRTLRSPVEQGDAPAVIGMRDRRLLVAVRAAVRGSGFAVHAVAASSRDLVAAVGTGRPRLVVASLDVLGSQPGGLVRRLLAEAPGAAVVVLSPLETLPLWFVHAGAHQVVAETDIAGLRRALRAVTGV